MIFIPNSLLMFQRAESIIISFTLITLIGERKIPSTLIAKSNLFEHPLVVILVITESCGRSAENATGATLIPPNIPITTSEDNFPLSFILFSILFS